MTKELFVSSTPHETKVGMVEDDQLAEIYLERENEYTLAGSIYKGRVTRVLPGMQSAFVDIGLERDAFLYVTDFLEEVEDQDDLDPVVLPAKATEQQSEERSERPSGRRQEHRGRRSEQQRAASASALQRPSEPAEEEEVETQPVEESVSTEAATSETQPSQAAGDGTDRGPRRWRGRRGRRRGRGGLS